ncbi:hypothetical protein QTO34_018209 [Cnephaeus nilssonii]|uniref:Serpin domain-containing protein n=1 Tax=Cnephaeus nilssonii TaxID=3371016 RepID=A0AA40HYH8_CNENI|nr:hypothetical protein QTO34_018209 [Eptesicus nilssonii]
MPRNVLPCCLVLSCIAPSKVDSAGEEAGIQLQVELVRNFWYLNLEKQGQLFGLSDHEHGTQFSHVGSGAVTGRPPGSGPAPDAPERPLEVLPASYALCGLVLAQIEEQLTLEKLHEWTKPENLSSTEVEVYLPTFKLEENYNLNSHLASLGIEDLFTTRADLSGMSRARDIFLSKIIHQSFVEVNEEGTEASAATVLILKGCSLMPVENFVADHPFIFFIRHNPSTNILFLGRLSSP